MKRIFAFFLALLLCFSGAACAVAEPGEAAPQPTPEPTAQALIEGAINAFGMNGAAGEAEECLLALEARDPDMASRWRGIFSCWQRLENVKPGKSLPDGLPDTDALCLVVLGYQLEADGSMREELYQRLRVALGCAKQYPHAYILCTGGHTASAAEDASEAGRMADWLIRNGVAPERVIAEEDSLTTTQNAEFTYAILRDLYPSVTSVAVISSDYHVNAGAVLLEAVSVLNAPAAAEAPFRVLACAACPVREGSARSFAVSGLKSLLRKYE